MFYFVVMSHAKLLPHTHTYTHFINKWMLTGFQQLMTIRISFFFFYQNVWLWFSQDERSSTGKPAVTGRKSNEMSFAFLTSQCRVRAVQPLQDSLLDILPWGRFRPKNASIFLYWLFRVFNDQLTKDKEISCNIIIIQVACRSSCSQEAGKFHIQDYIKENEL